MILKNAHYLNEEFCLSCSDLFIKDQLFAETSNGKEIDCSNYLVIPGLIDIHIHGSYGADTMDCNGFSVMSDYLARKGTTSFVPTTVSAPIIDVKNAVIAASKADLSGAVIRGINLEGPFINPVRRGAHLEQYIIPADIEKLKEIVHIAPGFCKLITIAPEIDGATELASFAMQNGMRISLGHTTADFDQTIEALSGCFSHITHMYNCMVGLGHRDPGTVGGIFDFLQSNTKEVFVETICDGVHIHPAAFRIAASLCGKARLVLISDCMRAGGMPDGEYNLGGNIVIVNDNKAYTKQGNLAGSCACLLDIVKCAVQCGMPLENAVMAATINPAKAIGLSDKIGSIAIGKSADCILVNPKTLELEMTIINGKIIYNRED